MTVRNARKQKKEKEAEEHLRKHVEESITVIDFLKDRTGQAQGVLGNKTNYMRA